MPRSLYDELQVPPNASPARIKHAFEQRATELRTSGTPLALRELNDVTRAYNTLSDPDKRSRYNSIMGLPDPDEVLAPAAASESGGRPAWVVPVSVFAAIMAVGIVIKIATREPSRKDVANATPATTPMIVDDPAADKPAVPSLEPVNSKWAEDHEKQQKAYYDKVKRDFENAQRQQDYQTQRNMTQLEYARRQEEYKAKEEERRRAYEAQAAEYKAREQQQREEYERRAIEAKQQQEVARLKRELQSIQERR